MLGFMKRISSLSHMLGHSAVDQMRNETKLFPPRMPGTPLSIPVVQQLRCPSPAAHKVQNDRNYGENEQNVNKPARYVKNSKAQ
jgi:hypothetical protein